MRLSDGKIELSTSFKATELEDGTKLSLFSFPFVLFVFFVVAQRRRASPLTLAWPGTLRP